MVTFRAELIRWTGAGAWVFAAVPEDQAPDRAGSFGRAPVVATVDGKTWRTSVWRGKDGKWLLPVPAKIRGAKDEGDTVTVDLLSDESRL